MQNGNVKSQNDGMVTITGNTINGNLTVSGVTGSLCVSDNTATGSVSYPPNPCSPGQRLGNEGAAGGMEIYPNPAGNQLSVIGERLSVKTNIEIYDALGRKVYSKPTTDNQPLTIDVSSLAKGIYKVVLINDSDLSTGTFVKE